MTYEVGSDVHLQQPILVYLEYMQICYLFMWVFLTITVNCLLILKVSNYVFFYMYDYCITIYTIVDILNGIFG